MTIRTFMILSVATLAASAVEARTLLTRSEALALAFPRGTEVRRESHFLSKTQLNDSREKSGLAFDDELVIRYVGIRDGQITGYAYFDSHRVRTLPETVMWVVNRAGAVERIEILSFSEPADYLPKRRWLDQMHGRRLDRELSLRGAIRPISGATLTGRALVDASRKILAIHDTIEAALRVPLPIGGESR